MLAYKLPLRVEMSKKKAPSPIIAGWRLGVNDCKN
jgi:hypothetical protein